MDILSKMMFKKYRNKQTGTEVEAVQYGPYSAPSLGLLMFLCRDTKTTYGMTETGFCITLGDGTVMPLNVSDMVIFDLDTNKLQSYTYDQFAQMYEDVEQ
jgi:hypothetical protein